MSVILSDLPPEVRQRGEAALVGWRHFDEKHWDGHEAVFPELPLCGKCGQALTAKLSAEKGASE